MGKRLFWIFLLSVAAISGIAVAYIQSESFARIVRRELQERVAKSLGVELNFERVKIGVLPPSLALQGVDLKVSSAQNQLGLATDTIFKAASLGFSFRMIQAFSRGITVNKIFLLDATVKMAIPKGKDGDRGEKLSALVHRPIRLRLSDNFFAAIRQVEVRNTKIDLAIGENVKIFADSISYLALTPSSEGTNLAFNAEGFSFTSPKVNESFKAIKLNTDVQRNSVLLSNLDVQRRDAAFHAAGKLVGSIDDIPETRPDVDIIVRGPIRELADFEKSLAGFSGEVLVDAKVVGRIKDPAFQGRLQISNFEKDLWVFDKVDLSGSFGGGYLVLDSFLVSKGEGKAFLKNKLEMQVPFKPASAAFQLRLEKARFEEFSGELRKSVNNLRMQLDGNINAKLDFVEAGGKVKLGTLSMRPDVTVRELELNNQVFGKQRPYKRIFKISPFQLNGNIKLQQGDLFVSDTKFTFSSGVMEVGGTHTERDGYDLVGNSGNVNLGAEVGEVSGIPVVGAGAVKIHVHGKDDDVKMDFDLKQQNANFVHFDFGKLEGRVTYDDRNNFILIPGVTGQKGSASYSAKGRVDLGDSEEIDLDVSFGESAPDDLFAIFEHQLADISWIPRGMIGAVSGKAKVGGKYSDGLNLLEIDSQLKGRNLSYKGEVFQEVEARAGVSKAVAFGHQIRATKYQTPFSASIDFNLRTDEMRYQIQSDQGKLRSLDFLGSLGLPIDGLYSLRSEGRGRWETLESKTTFQVSSGFVRTRPIPDLSLEYTTTAGASFFSGSLGADARVRGKISHQSKDESYAEFSLQKANFDFLLCMLNRSNCADSSLNLGVSSEGRFFWKGWNWRSMDGGGMLQEFRVAKAGYNLRLREPVKLASNDGMLDSSKGELEGEDTKINFQLSGRVDGEELENSIRGVSSLKLLELITSLIQEARGRMRLDMNLSGDLRNGFFRGGINMEEGMLRLTGLQDAPLENLEAHLRFQNSRLTIEKLAGQLGGGSVKATGGLDLYLNRPPRFGIDLYLSNGRLKFFPINYAEISDAKLSFTGDAPPYLFSGTARAKKVLMRNNFDLGRGQKSLQNAKYLPEKIAGIKSFYEVRIRGVADSGVFVENNLLNAEFRGEITLLNNFEFPQVVGRAELVRGKLLFRNTAFALDHASIRIPNPEVFNPMFSIGGIANVDNYRINIFASGTADRPKVTLSSYPALPQEDIVSLLAFGYRGEDARKINPNDTSAITYSEVGSILLEQLQLSQNLQSKGLRVTVAPSLQDNEASLIRPNSAATAAPKVYVQSQVAKNLEAILGGTVGAAQGQTMDAKVEYRLSRRASVRGIYEQSSSGIDATDTKNSYGADLRFRWEFK